MKNKIMKRIGRFIGITGILLPLFCLTGIPQAQSRENIHSGLINHLLRISGIRAEMIQLQHPDGFSKAILIEKPQETSIIIGFKQNKAEKGETFLISVDGCEKVVKISEDGSFVIMDEDEDGISIAICIFDVIIDTVKAIELCDDESFCIAMTIFTMVLDIIQCAD